MFKKTIIAAAALGMLSVSALAATASDSIDSAGNISVAIVAPASAAAPATASKQLSLDSNGSLSAAEPKIVAAAPMAEKTTDKATCVDSGCQVQLQL